MASRQSPTEAEILRAAAERGLVRLDLGAIARRAETSEATTRRALHGGPVSPESRARVLAALGIGKPPEAA